MADGRVGQRTGIVTPVVIRLWDLPVRLIHWSLVLLLIGLWWTAEKSADIGTHKTLGIVLLGLLAFRILWGLVGSQTARFSQFVGGPRKVLGYFRSLRTRDVEPVVGHNPLGGWSVIALLLVLLVQVVAGLFAQDVDGIESGPLSYLVSYDWADSAREWHHLMFNLILGLVAVHLAAILFYHIGRRTNLIGPMLTGRKTFAVAVVQPRLVPVWRVIACAVVAGAFAWWVALGCPLPGVTS